VILYNPVLHPEDFMAGTGGDTRVRLGVFCEVLLIVANVGTAVVIFPILRRQNETLALGYVTARLVECTFIRSRTAAILAHASPASAVSHHLVTSSALHAQSPKARWLPALDVPEKDGVVGVVGAVEL
jgi:hypothetical protein